MYTFGTRHFTTGQRVTIALGVKNYPGTVIQDTTLAHPCDRVLILSPNGTIKYIAANNIRSHEHNPNTKRANNC